jgi:ubiquinol-cytochrome c reductase cytochrome b subunit
MPNLPVRSAVSRHRADRAGDAPLRVGTPLRALLNRVFPDHWSFLLGEIALFSFVVLLITGAFLAVFYDPSALEVTYAGAYGSLRGVRMSAAYASTLDISFDVRGGLIVRQIHHWAALLFLAALMLHLLRVFFTGAFRRPRRFAWIAGALVFWVGVAQAYAGTMLPDDGRSFIGLGIAWSIVLSVPIVGTWLAASLFGGEFPGDAVIHRLYALHTFVLPALLLVLLLVLVGLTLRDGGAQWPGPRRTNATVVGERLFPRYVLKRVGLFLVVAGTIALIGGLLQINPVWVYGPARAEVVTAAAQPDWYVLFLEGGLRLMPAWDIPIPVGEGYVIPALFWPGIVLPAVLFGLSIGYPFLRRGDHRHHHLLQRPRDVPARTALGAMAVTFWSVLTLAGAGDVIALTFHISLNAVIWAGRILLVVFPPLVYSITYRLCLGLQQHDREVLVHGIETGIVRRRADGGYVEVHQPLPGGGRYAGAPVPKKLNQVLPNGPRDPNIRGSRAVVGLPNRSSRSDG